MLIKMPNGRRIIFHAETGEGEVTNDELVLLIEQHLGTDVASVARMQMQLYGT
jgi:hypothetical protein